MSTSILEGEVESSTATEDEIVTSTDKPNSSHIVMVPEYEDDETPQAYVLRARIEGFPIKALCGYVFVPNKSAKELPVCQECLDIYHQPGDNRDDRDKLPDE